MLRSFEASPPSLLLVKRASRVTILVALVASLPTRSARAQTPQTPRRGANVLVSSGSPFPKVETTIATNPSRPNVLIGGAIEDAPLNSRVVLYASHDAGGTWTSVPLPDLAPEGSGDPQVAFSPDGIAYASALTIAYRGTAATARRMSVQVFRSVDDGAHWTSAAAYGAGAFTDHPQMFVDSVAVRGRVIATALYWDTDQTSDTRLVLFHSRDRGNHFASPLPIVADSDHRLFNLNPLQFSDGSVFVPFARFRDGPAGACKPFDVDAMVVDAALTRHSDERAVRHDVPDPNGCGTALPYAKVMFGIDARRGADRLYVALNEPRGDHYEVTFSFSDDRGRTWSPPRSVSPGNHDQFRPAIAVDGSGVVGVSWCEVTGSGPQRTFVQRFTASYDRGGSFSPSALVSTAPSPVVASGNDVAVHSINSPSSRPDGSTGILVTLASSAGDAGEYTGLTSNGRGVFYPFWADSRTGVSQVWTAAVYTNEAQPRPPAAVASAASLRDIAIAFEPSEYDSAARVFTIPVRLHNTGAVEECGRLSLEVVGSSAGRHPTILNADNGMEWSGARFDFTGAAGELNCIPPGQVTDAVTIQARALAPARPLERPSVPLRVRVIRRAKNE
jgi:hypothetical protein